MLKSQLENCAFCKSLYFYIMGSGNHTFQGLKNGSATTLSTSCWHYWLVYCVCLDRGHLPRVFFPFRGCGRLPAP